MVQELGKGAYGTVVEAVREDTQETVAVKVMSKLRAHQTPDKTAMYLRRECQMLELLQGKTEHVVRLHGIYEDSANVYVVTEKLGDGSLLDLMASRGGRVMEEEARWIAADIIDFIAACHRSGVIYMDAKPANFMLDSSNGRLVVKAVDLGCSHKVPLGCRLPFSRGTPLFMAPEVFRRSTGHESDLWSVGIILYFILTGRNPWFDDLEGVTPNDVSKKVVEEEVQYDETEWASISFEARDLVERMLTKDTEFRITAEQAAAHPWLAAKGSKNKPGVTNNITPLANPLSTASAPVSRM